MKGSCPQCGSSAAFVSQASKSFGATEVVFRCESASCGAELVAEVRFTLLSQRSSHQFSRAGELAGDGLKTDC